MNSPVPDPPRSQPPAGKKFPCLQCGARLDYDPALRGMKCPYCGYEQILDTGNLDIREHDLDRYLADGKGKSRVQGRTNEVQCGTCGAVVLLEDKVATETCPYCANHIDNQPHEAEAMIPPEAIVPFAIDQQGAIDAFRRWLKGLWFAPRKLVKVDVFGQCSGVYLPFWTFDAMTHTHYTGERGDNYVTTESYTESESYTDSNGHAQTRLVTKTRNVTRTRWSRVTGDVEHFFDDVLVSASETLPPEHLATFGDSALASLVPFRPEYLAGFVTERYTVGPRDGHKKACEVMERHIRHLIARDIGGDDQRISSIRTQNTGMAFKQVLLPIWLASYRFQNQTYRVMVNGLTGEVVGDRPYSWKQIVSLILVVLVAILGLITLILWTAH